ncbi:DUF5689 domain-containing protein [Winogradskyella litorisediminis]|uniref:DUF5689 domain-containing protein n=1 Tax=Winogradskyella litorisediminis TaxID=1156618 RepID=A0ABW3N783_9FLAO
MKTLKINKFILLLIGLVAFNSCVEDDDFSIPNTAVSEPEFGSNDQIIPISSVAGQLAQEQGSATVDFSDDDTIYTYPADGPTQYVSGYVVSSDEGGNYFEELILQNAPENPTIGVRVLVDVNPLFVRYEVGRKVFIKLNGLSSAISNGVLTIGPKDGDRLGKIPAAVENDFILRATEVATIVPLPLAISDFTEDKTNLMIELNNVQFNRNQALPPNALSYAAEGSDQFDGERLLESCDDSASTIFATSTFADFKALTLPSGKGSMVAVLQRNFFGDAYNVVVNSPEDINFDDPNRCDPVFLDCNGPVSSAFTVFEEDFQSITNESQLDGMGWTNVNVSGGSERYERNAFSGDTYMKISAFGTGENPLEAWLVTPAINLDSTTEENLSFEISANFETGTVLSVLITDSFTGDVTTTDWAILDANVPVGSGGFGPFVESNVNISCLDGDVHVAFKYLGAAGGAETRYHIDDIVVTGQN